MKIAACYIRVSTDDQLEYSPDSQLEKIREFAKRNDMVLSESNIFIEEDGVSGRKAAKRQQFQRMIAMAKSKPKPFDVILVWKFSRFARNREDSIVYKSMLRKQLGIEVVSVSENIGDDKMSVITEAIIEAMDEYYSINLGEEVKRGMTEKAKRGEWNSIAPFGYKLENKQLVIYEEQAEIVKEVFVRYVNGWGHKKIATWLNSIGVKTNRGGGIENRTVEYWLNNPVYHGYVRWTPTGKTSRDYNNPDSIIEKGSHPPIIDEELWEATQKRLIEQKNHYTKNRRESTPTAYALSGIVRCSACGATLARANGRYMQCISYAKGTCKTSHFVKMDMLEMMLYSAIKSDLESGSFSLVRGDAKKPSSDAAAIALQLAKAELKLERIREAYESGIDTLEEYKTNKARISAEIDKLQSLAAESSDAEISPESKDLYSKKQLQVLETIMSGGVSEEEKNRLLKGMIKTATFSKAERKVSVEYLY